MLEQVITVTVPVPPERAPLPETLEVIVANDGTVIARMDAETAARLAGRSTFGDVDEQQTRWADAIADAWYAAGCPPAAA